MFEKSGVSLNRVECVYQGECIRTCMPRKIGVCIKCRQSKTETLDFKLV